MRGGKGIRGRTGASERREGYQGKDRGTVRGGKGIRGRKGGQ